MDPDYVDAKANYNTGIEARQTTALAEQTVRRGSPQAERSGDASPLQEDYDKAIDHVNALKKYVAKPSDSID